MKALKILFFILAGLVSFLLIIAPSCSNVPWDHKLSDNETKAYDLMLRIIAAQNLYYNRFGKFLPSVQTLAEKYLGQESFNANRGGYIFKVKLVSSNVWEATAAPALPGVSGKIWFFTTSLDGEVRRKWYEPADSLSYSYKTGKGELNGPSMIDRWFYRESQFHLCLTMAFWIGILTFCILILYLLLKVLGVGQKPEQ